MSAKQPSAQAPPGSDPRFELIDATSKRLGYSKSALIEVLHTAQQVFGYLPTDVLQHVAKRLKMPPSQVYGVATFYQQFSFTPLGEHLFTVCMGTACYVKRAEDIITEVQAAFGVSSGETSADGKLSVRSARCVGSCGLAPVVIIDSTVVGKDSPQAVVQRLHALLDTPGELAV
jgi:bidirectional [NiFe] hydrogenase diaphorase subunit